MFHVLCCLVFLVLASNGGKNSNRAYAKEGRQADGLPRRRGLKDLALVCMAIDLLPQ